MRNLLKSTKYIFLFIAAQCTATMIYVFFKIKTDSDWVYRLSEIIDANGIKSTEYMEFIGNICVPMLIIADIIILIPILFKCKKDHIQLIKKVSLDDICIYITIGLLLNFVISCIVDFLPKTNAVNNYDMLTESLLGNNFLIVFLSSGILAPIIEELIFRFLICKTVYGEKIQKGIIVSSVLFGLAHMNLIQSTYAFILGIILAAVYVKNEHNLLIPIIMHITINGSSIIYEYFNHKIVLTAGATFVLLVAIYNCFCNYAKKKNLLQ